MVHRRFGVGENSGGDVKQSLLDSLRAIQLEQAHGRSAAGGERLDAAALQTKVFRPTIAARIEERHNRAAFRVDGSQIAPFETIAESAGQREIAGIGGATVFHGDDVIDLVRREGHRFRDKTILAAVVSAQPYRTPQFGWDVRTTHGGSLDLSWSAAFALAIRTRCSMY